MSGWPGALDWEPGGSTLSEHVVAAMRVELPDMAEKVVTEIQAEVSEYADPFRGEMGRTIQNAVALALGGFLTLVSGDSQARDDTYERVWNAAHALGRGEARSGRSLETLLRAYRIGARVSWRDMSAAGVGAGLDAGRVAGFAALVFSYIDELSAASAAGHSEELAVAGRLRERLLEQLADAMLAGRPAATVTSLAERAGWALPTGITAVLVPQGSADRTRGRLPRGTVQASGASGQQPGDATPPVDTLLVPGGPGVRPVIRRALADEAVIGPTVAWEATSRSAERAVRVLRLHTHDRLGAGDASWGVLDADEHLAAVVLAADEGALSDLRARVVAPLQALRPSTAGKLEETLRAWLLHQGRREAMAHVLFVHPQTVRYRVGQLRELYGAVLEDPQWVLEATIALGVGGGRDPRDQPPGSAPLPPA